ncbi:MAG TPA: hypothetical protein VKE91_08480, partial [Blastocatellia bacterium]|nr:hypothetical protein [Blastocatellia bacterium]
MNKIRFAARRSFLTVTACFICVACLSVQAQNTAPQSPPTPADLKVPEGFKVSVFASDVTNARLMAVSPDGVLYVARQSKGDVVALPDRDKDGKADKMEVVASNLTRPHSLAFHKGFLYIATNP